MIDEAAYLCRLGWHWNHDPIHHGVFCFLLLVWVAEVLWREGRLM